MIPLAGQALAYVVRGYVDLALTVFTLIVEVISFVHCMFQRREAFPALGTLPKGIWLALTGGAAVLTLLLGLSPSTSMIGLIGLIAGAVYLLDVKPRLRDLTDGNPW